MITPGLIIFAPPPEKGYGFATLPKKPQLVHDRRLGKMPRDLEGLSGYLLVSERLKQLFEVVDPAGFEFVECDFKMADGSTGPRYYLADVVRVLDALNEEASRLRIRFEPSGRKVYSFAGGAKLVFRDDIAGSTHIFRTPYSLVIFCDDVLKAACKKASITGTWFIDADRM